MAGCATPDNPNYITSETTGFWSKYIVWPLSWLMTEVANLFGGSFGISIIIVTILLRLAILPLMIKQTKNSKAMQAIQPEIQKLREKYNCIVSCCSCCCVLASFELYFTKVKRKI